MKWSIYWSLLCSFTVQGFHQGNQMKERSESTANSSITSVFYSVKLLGSQDLQVACMSDWMDICGSGTKQKWNALWWDWCTRRKRRRRFKIGGCFYVMLEEHFHFSVTFVPLELCSCINTAETTNLAFCNTVIIMSLFQRSGAEP